MSISTSAVDLWRRPKNGIGLFGGGASKLLERSNGMKTKMAILLLVAVLVAPALATAASEDDFLAKTTRNILNLCNAAADDPLHDKAIHFCHGYLVGAYAYYAAESSGPEGKRLVCFPEPPPTRNSAIAMFLEWAKAHPEYMDEPPVETEFRFLMEKWPCER
jgi:hypothetical protein